MSRNILTSITTGLIPWRNIRDDLKHIRFAQLSSPHGAVWQVTEPRQDVRNRLKSLKIKNLPEVLQLT